MNQADVEKKYVVIWIVLDWKVFIQFDQVNSEKKKEHILPFIKAYFKEIMYIMASRTLATFLFGLKSYITAMLMLWKPVEEKFWFKLIPVTMKVKGSQPK